MKIILFTIITIQISPSECKEGSYGKNCMYNCSINCIQTSQCDRFSGSCDGGCIDGWDGSRCTESEYLCFVKNAYFCI